MGTGKDQKITITASSGLSEQEIQKMVKEAAEHESEDKARREQVERRNKRDSLCYTLEKTLRESPNKLPASDVTSLEALIRDGRTAVEQQDDALITSTIARLEKEAHRVASVMYQGTPGANAPADTANSAGAGGDTRPDIVDAEFDDVHHTAAE